MTWSEAVLATTTSIAKIETEINDLTNATWDDILDQAKELIGDKLEVILSGLGVKVDEADGKVLLDVIHNPDAFDLSCNYLGLSLIFEELAQGADGLYQLKQERYYAKFEVKFAEDIKRMNFDYDADGTVDAYRVNTSGRLVR